MGVTPCRIDLGTAIDEVEFDEAWSRRTTVRIGELEVPLLGRDHRIRDKRASVRPQDLADVAWLEANGGGPGRE